MCSLKGAQIDNTIKKVKNIKRKRHILKSKWSLSGQHSNAG